MNIVNDFIKSNDNGTIQFYTLQEFSEVFQVNTNFLTYHGLLAVIKNYLSSYNLRNITLSYPIIPVNLEIFIKSDKGAKVFYNILIKNNILPTGRKKWDTTFNLDDCMWSQIYQTPFKVTKNTKLQWLQYRIVHHVLTTNSFLFKVGLATSPLCSFCNAERETIVHVIWDCREVQQLLQSLEILLDSLLIPFQFNKTSYMFGFWSHNNINNRIDNEIILIIKQYIYNTRCYHKALNINALINLIRDHYKVQKYIATRNGERAKENFTADWEKWKPLIDLSNS